MDQSMQVNLAEGKSEPYARVAKPLTSPRWPAAALAAEYWLAPGRFIERCSRLGDRFTLRLPGAGAMVCVTHPKDIKRVFTADPETLYAAVVVKRFLPHHLIFGEEIIVGYDGAKHLASRRLGAPPFHGDALKAYEPTMVAKTEEALAAWPYGTEVSFKAQTAPIALEIIMATVFGVTARQRLDTLRERTMAFLGVLQTKRFLLDTAWATARGGKWTGSYDYIRDARRRVDEVVREEIDERRRRGDVDRRDILGIFLRTRDERGEPMSDAEILNSMSGLLLAGFETTATTHAWGANAITRRPDVLARLEADARDGDDAYIDAVITETLRLRSPAMFNFRYVVRPFALDDDLVLAPGTVVAPFIAAVHRRPDLYPDPLRFEPERFLRKQPDPYAWLPFGGGIRRCLGGAFAMLELRAILRTILRHARFRAVRTPSEAIGRSNVVLTPRAGGRATLDRIAT